VRGVDDFECAMKGRDNWIRYQSSTEGVAEDAYVESQRVDRRRYFDHVLLDLTSAADKKSVLWRQTRP